VCLKNKQKTKICCFRWMFMKYLKLDKRREDANVVRQKIVALLF